MRVRPARRSGGAAGLLRRTLLRGSIITGLVAIAAVALSACGGTSAGSVKNSASSYGTTLYGKLPAVGTPTSGGDVTVGQISGQTPDFIFPLTDCTHQTTVDDSFISHLFVPLFNGPIGARPEINYQLSAATGAPVPSNGGKTYTINLSKHLTWSNGAPVDANDVIFYIDLVKAAIKESPANWCSYIPGQFPDDLISATAPNKYTVVLKLTKAFNPGYFLNDQVGAIDPMPSTAWNIASANGPHLDFTKPANATKIYNYLFKQGSDLSKFVSSPLWKDIDGAWKLKDYSLTNNSYDILPNAKYTGPAKPKLSEVSYVTYTSTVAQLNALKSNSLDIGGLDATQLTQAKGLEAQGFSVFGNPTWGFYDALINFHDGTGHFGAVVKNLYARQVLYELEDQPQIAKGIYKGAAVPQYGPIPSQPQSPYTPADAVKPLYPYNPAKAVATLKAHGWKVVPGGKSTCIRPGTAANECGAGVPKGSGFGGVWLNVPESVAPSFVLSSEAIVSEDKEAAGIDFTFKTITFDIAQQYNDQSAQGKALENNWAINNTGGFSISYYPTSEQIFNTGGAYNEGDYSDPTADKLMLASVTSTNPKAVTAEASYLAKSPPVLFLPDPDSLGVVSKRVGGSANSFLQLVYQIDAPQYWYVKKAATS
jgi:peptide/nickel transport system substrate-binding protein